MIAPNSASSQVASKILECHEDLTTHGIDLGTMSDLDLHDFVTKELDYFQMMLQSEDSCETIVAAIRTVVGATRQSVNRR